MKIFSERESKLLKQIQSSNATPTTHRTPGLRAARHRRKWNTAELSEASGVPEKSIWNYEQNLNEPKAGGIVRLAKALGVTSDELLGLTEAQ